MPWPVQDLAEEPDSALVPSEVASAHSAAELLQHAVARDLLDLRYKHGLSEVDIDHVKACSRRWAHEIAGVAAMQLIDKGLVQRDVSMEALRAALSVNVYDGLETKAKEFTAKRDLPYLEPRVVYPKGDGKGEPIISFDQAALYFRRLNHDAAFRKTVVAKSDELKTGSNYHKVPEVLDDILQGVVARWHPHVHRPATAEEEYDVRVVQLEQVDDLELCNTLGVARGLHKQCGVQEACLNLPAEERFCPENIMVPVLSRASVYKDHGMARVLAGVDKSGKQHDEPNHVADLDALD